ncbi:M20 family metallopeptidase [Clostridium sp. DJ247]|uniref:M20 family metallopeptidase n=1 Tax=Clostridium sp. DJ247 TaxID=2726188 RepID=UPI001629B542|nr:M20 family metallopeptidase [Clostridium sp. DJ247]MBC2579660.1 amidohydrolase [Clostridium sp. DJ247]
MDLCRIIRDNMETIFDIRKELSKNAELSFKEFKTAEILKNFLDKLGISTETILETGVVALINEGQECLAIRADMDALPVNGVSHACGHDYHMAVALGCALVLKNIGFSKCIKFIFQPGEEDIGGAAPMIDRGVLENPKVKNIIGFHVWPGVEVGKIQVTAGPSMASVDDFAINFKGKGGHAAMPYLCKNPIYPALDFIQSMNQKINIENDPLNPFVITFSSINAGNACNVIADDATILGTLRTFDNHLRKKLIQEITDTANICAQKYKCGSQVNFDPGYPPLISDKALTDKFIDATTKILGKENVLDLERSFAAEDFAFFAEKVPSVHFRLGISDGLKGQHPLHSTKFDVSDEALYYGIYAVVNFILSMEDEL